MTFPGIIFKNDLSFPQFYSLGKKKKIRSNHSISESGEKLWLIINIVRNKLYWTTITTKVFRLLDSFLKLCPKGLQERACLTAEHMNVQ